MMEVLDGHDDDDDDDEEEDLEALLVEDLEVLDLEGRDDEVDLEGRDDEAALVGDEAGAALVAAVRGVAAHGRKGEGYASLVLFAFSSLVSSSSASLYFSTTSSLCVANRLADTTDFIG